MKIKVIKSDIQNATKRDCEKCAVAIAVTQKLKGTKWATQLNSKGDWILRPE